MTFVADKYSKIDGFHCYATAVSFLRPTLGMPTNSLFKTNA